MNTIPFNKYYSHFGIISIILVIFSLCFLLFKEGLSKNAIKRLKILKSTNDGFFIAEEDMKMRGFGDILGFKQSGIKNFKLADPIHNNDLFLLFQLIGKTGLTHREC